MTGTSFASLIRLYTRTNATTLTNAEIVLMANVVKDDIAKEIIKADEDFFGSIAQRDLVASSDSDMTAREYSLPENILKVKKVEAKLDGTNWIPLNEFNINQYKRTTNESEILTNFANEEGKAFYDIFRKSLWIYSGAITATTLGLQLWQIVFPADITTDTLSGSTDLSVDPTTSTAGLPRQFHELWARKCSIMYKSNREKPIPLTQSEQNVDKDFRLAMASIRNLNLDRENSASLPDDTALQN